MMSSKELAKSKSAPRDICHDNQEEDVEDPNDLQAAGGSAHSAPDTDIFSFLSAMNSSFMGGQIHPAAVQVLANRKRKFLDQGSTGKLFGGLKYPGHRRNSDDDPPLQTPQCSQSGYADEEDRRHHQLETEQETIRQRAHSNLMTDIDENLASDFDGSLSGLGVDIATSTYSMSEALLALPNLTISNGHIFKQEVPSPPTTSLHDHHSTSGSRGISGHSASLKEEHLSSPSFRRANKIINRDSPQSFHALDLSNDETAHFPDSAEEVVLLGPKTFTGSVLGSRGGTPNNLSAAFQASSLHSSNSHHQLHQLSSSSQNIASLQNCYASTMSASHPNLTSIGTLSRDELTSNASSPAMSLDSSGMTKSHRVILPLQNGHPPSAHQVAIRKISHDQMTNESSSSSMTSENLNISGGAGGGGVVSNNGCFQFVLKASTSIATKVNEPSITYLNQGQSYEVTLKRLVGYMDSAAVGGIGGVAPRKRLLRCIIRISFHERRLQYMELEQITEWSLKHPGERILDLDMPLSYGIIDPVRDPCHLNAISFKWDPSRDTGAYIKVNCISTEFTPKKHGGEKGVPFRLLVETFDQEDNQLFAAGCILQIFKLKGADRKHKQDRDKVQKRPSSEQEKYARQCDQTLLTPLPLESLYSHSSFSVSSRPESPDFGSGDGSLPQSRHTSREEQNGAIFFEASSTHPDSNVSSMVHKNNSFNTAMAPSMGATALTTAALSATATVEQVVQWLGRNRYGSLLATFRNYNGRDLMRLSRDDIVAMCGLIEGLRLYNDLHMVSVAPRLTIYVALKDSDVYDAIFLDEFSFEELAKRLAAALAVQPSGIGNIFKKSRTGVQVRVNDSVVRNLTPESVFYVATRKCNDDEEFYDVIMEESGLESQQNSNKINNNDEEIIRDN